MGCGCAGAIAACAALIAGVATMGWGFFVASVAISAVDAIVDTITNKSNNK